MDCSDGSDEGVGCPELEQSKENYFSSDLTTTEVFCLDTEDMIDQPEYIKPTWIAILTTALILACLVALTSILLKCKRDQRGGRRGVWVTPRIFGPDGQNRKSLFQTGICQQMPVNFSSSVKCCKYFIKVLQDNFMIR